MTNEKRHAVNLTEKEINALIVSVGNIRVGDVHICRVKQLHNGLEELRSAQTDIQRANRG